ncbi:MAG: hypothetical protein AAFP98_03770 [Pseudomonadota bacterium]
MRNDTHKWTAPSPLTRTVAGLRCIEVHPLAQHWLSGPDVLGRFADNLITWPTPITQDKYVLSLRRDRVMVVGGLDLPDGYHAATGLAVTDISDAYQVIDISGPAAFAHLQRGAEVRVDQPSRSVQRRMFGCDVMLCCLDAESGFRIHVPRAFAQSFVEQLCH